MSLLCHQLTFLFDSRIKILNFTGIKINKNKALKSKLLYFLGTKIIFKSKLNSMKSQMIIKYKIHFNQHDIGVEYLTILLMTNLGK